MQSETGLESGAARSLPWDGPTTSRLLADFANGIIFCVHTQEEKKR